MLTEHANLRYCPACQFRRLTLDREREFNTRQPPRGENSDYQKNLEISGELTSSLTARTYALTEILTNPTTSHPPLHHREPCCPASSCNCIWRPNSGCRLSIVQRLLVQNAPNARHITEIDTKMIHRTPKHRRGCRTRGNAAVRESKQPVGS